MMENLSYPVCGAKDVSKAILRPSVIWSSMVISVFSTLSVFHFSVNVRPAKTNIQ